MNNGRCELFENYHTRAELEQEDPLRIIDAFEKLAGEHQALFGIVQGSNFPDLRERSAKGVASQGFDGIALGVSATGENWGEGNWYGLGATVGFGNFVVGSSWGHIEDDYAQGENSRTAGDTDSYDIGVSYAMDAAAVSLTYGYADYGDGSTSGGRTGAGELNQVDLGLSYTLGAGIAWRSSVFWFDNEVEGAEDNDGYGAVTGIALTF